MKLRVLLTTAVIAVAGLATAPGPASAGAARMCRSADLRYPFEPGGDNTFGVFRLRVDGGSCATAHRVAQRWMRRFEASIRTGDGKLPKRVAGFTFTTLRTHAAQTFAERGRRGGTTIRFDYVVPNG